MQHSNDIIYDNIMLIQDQSITEIDFQTHSIKMKKLRYILFFSFYEKMMSFFF